MIWISKRTFVLGLAALGIAVASGPAGAADATDLAGAKTEDKVSWYTSTPIENIPAVFAGLLIVIVIGLVVENLIFRTIERNTIRKWGLHS